MSNTVAIDAYTGPGLKATTVQVGVQEINFNMGKKTIEVIHADGSMGQYDLAAATDIQIVSDGENFTVTITSEELTQEMKDERAKNDKSERLTSEWKDRTNYTGRGFLTDPDNRPTTDSKSLGPSKPAPRKS